MSIFRLKNKTGYDSQQSWARDFVFPNNVEIDLIDPGTYNDIPYHLGFSVDDLIGIKGGLYFENIRLLIKTGTWCLNDGDIDLPRELGLILLKSGNCPIHKTVIESSTKKPVAFESHNFMDSSKWPNGQSKFEVVPFPGKKLILNGSKTLISLDCVNSSLLYFRIYVGSSIVQEQIYTNINELMLGADDILVTPQIGNPSTTGTLPLVNIIYKYKDPIILYSSYGMKLVVGFLEDIPPDKISLLRVRIEGTPEDEI